MPAHCIECRRPFGICEVTLETPDGELCEDCDESYQPSLRPSLGFVPSLLRSVARGETERTEENAQKSERVA